MTYTTSTTILGPCRGSVDAILTYATAKGAKRLSDLCAYLETVYRIAPQIGLRAEVVVAQSAHETGIWTSAHWVNSLNPAGIAITSSTATSPVFATGEAAALAQLTHLWLYAVGTSLPTGLNETSDPRWDAAVSAGRAGIATTLDDLSGTWATDTAYAVGIVKHLNALEAAGALTSTSGASTVATYNFDPALVPLPKHDLDLNYTKTTGMNKLGNRTLRGIVFHRCLSDGQTFAGAVDWLKRPSTAGLTDGFVDHRTGQMRFINPMKSLAATFTGTIPSSRADMAGWANGPYKSALASADGRAFVNAYGGTLGADIINQDLESVEVTGDYDTEISEATKQTLAQWAASRAQLLKVPWDSFPIIPSTGLTMIYGHREFCGTDYKLCPGSVVWTFINGELISRVQTILKAAQTQGATVTPSTPSTDDQTTEPTTYAKPIKPSYLDSDLPVIDDAGTTVFRTNAQYVAIRDTPRLQRASSKAPKVGPDIKAGEDFPIAFVFTSKSDGEQYGLTNYGTRVKLADLKVVGTEPLKA